MLPKVSRESLSLPLLSVWWWPAILGIFWLIESPLQSLPLSSPGNLPVCVSLHVAFLQRHRSLDLGPTLIQVDPNLTNYIYKDSLSK